MIQERTEPTEPSAEARESLEGFGQGFSRVRQTNEPAADPVEREERPAGAADPADEVAAENSEDELASLPPRVRALFQELEQQMPTLRNAAAAVPKITERLSKTEGRLGDVHQRLKAIPPPAPTAAPKVEQLEKLRTEGLPEVADAIEAFFEAKLASAKPTAAPADLAADTTPADRAQERTSGTEQVDSPTKLLDAEEPDWQTIAGGQEFSKWLTLHNPQEYEAKIRATRNEGVMLAAIARFKDWKGSEAAKAEAAAAEAARVAKTRQARATAAVVPTGPVRRTPATAMTEEDAFEQGFKNRRI